jgi:hypothetical protein
MCQNIAACDEEELLACRVGEKSSDTKVARQADDGVLSNVN